MSYQNSYSNPKNYSSVSSQQMGVPESLVSSLDQKMIASTTTIKSIASQSGDQNSNGIIQFMISSGSGQGYIKSGSAYIKCKITFTKTAAAGTVSFLGGLSAAGELGTLGGGSASAIINRMSISSGGTLINSIQNYHVLHSTILNHCTNANYRSNDSAIMEFTGKTFSSAAGTFDIDVCLPVMMPVLNSTQSLPLFALNSPLILEVLLNNIANCIANLSTNMVTEFKVSGATLVYECLNVSSDFENAVKSKLVEGNVFSMVTNDYYNVSVSELADINYSLGLNLSSVMGVLYTSQMAVATAGFVRPFSANVQTNAQLFVDGRLINQMPLLSTQAQIYMEFQRAISSMYDYTATSCNIQYVPLAADVVIDPAAPTASSPYMTRNFCGGISCNRSSDSGFIFTGTPCQTINFTRTTTLTAGTLFLMVLYSQMIIIDGSGSVSIIR